MLFVGNAYSPPVEPEQPTPVTSASYTVTYDATIGSAATIDLGEFLPAALAELGETADVDFDKLKLDDGLEWLDGLLLNGNTQLQLSTSPDYSNPDFDGVEGFYVILTTDDDTVDTDSYHVYRIQLTVDVAPAWGAHVQTYWAIPISNSSYSLELPTPMDDGRSDVTYSLLNAPAGVSLTGNTLTGNATGVAITYVASDAFNSATLTLTLTLTPEENIAPDWATTESNGSLTTTIEFGLGMFTTTLAAAEDANTGQLLTYSVDALPEGWLFDATTRELIGTFDALPQLRTFDYTVSDGELSDTTTVTLDFDLPAHLLEANRIDAAATEHWEIAYSYTDAATTQEKFISPIRLYDLYGRLEARDLGIYDSSRNAMVWTVQFLDAANVVIDTAPPGGVDSDYAGTLSIAQITPTIPEGVQFLEGTSVFGVLPDEESSSVTLDIYLEEETRYWFSLQGDVLYDLQNDTNLLSSSELSDNRISVLPSSDIEESSKLHFELSLLEANAGKTAYVPSLTTPLFAQPFQRLDYDAALDTEASSGKYVVQVDDDASNSLGGSSPLSPEHNGGNFVLSFGQHPTDSRTSFTDAASAESDDPIEAYFDSHYYELSSEGAIFEEAGNFSSAFWQLPEDEVEGVLTYRWWDGTSGTLDQAPTESEPTLGFRVEAFDVGVDGLGGLYFNLHHATQDDSTLQNLGHIALEEARFTDNSAIWDFYIEPVSFDAKQDELAAQDLPLPNWFLAFLVDDDDIDHDLDSSNVLAFTYTGLNPDLDDPAYNYVNLADHIVAHEP